MIYAQYNSKEINMAYHTSRISAKGQITVPQKVREQVGLKSGDLVSYEVEDGRVILRPIEPFDLAYHAAVSGTLGEWNTPEDNKAFRDL